MAGKNIEPRMLRLGIGLLNAVDALKTFSRVLTLTLGTITVCPFNWRTYREAHGIIPSSFFTDCWNTADEKQNVRQKALLDQSSVTKTDPAGNVLNLATNIVNDAIGPFVHGGAAPDQPFLEAGLDSLSSVEFVNILDAAITDELGTERNLGRKPLPATLVFDYPTPSALSEQLARILDLNGTDTTSHINSTSRRLCYNGDSIYSLSCTRLLAVGHESAAEQFQSIDASLRSIDAVKLTPLSRWDLGFVAGGPRVHLSSSFCAFLADVASFDNVAYSVAQGEAAVMDPQQREFLTWSSIILCSVKDAFLSRIAAHHPGRGVFPSAVLPFGVYVGVATTDYARIIADAKCIVEKSTLATGSEFLSVVAGRVSFMLNARGAAMAVDTACSSGLVALHLARHDIVLKVQDLGRDSVTSDDNIMFATIAGGVNIIVHPATSAIFAAAGMLSLDGRCKTLDADANGYVRGEACVALALDVDAAECYSVSGEKAHASLPHDGNCNMLNAMSCEVGTSHSRIFLIPGISVNQDGRSSSLTAPNGPSQQRVLRAAQVDAERLIPGFSGITLLQLHGTGTPLGDPIEIGAALTTTDNSLLSGTSHRLLKIGASKACMGHTESPSGLIGLVAATLINERDSSLLGIPHLRVCNPHVVTASTCTKVIFDNSFVAPRQLAAIPDTTCAGASAFAFQGTNAHAVSFVVETRGYRDACEIVSHRFAHASRMRFWITPSSHTFASNFQTERALGILDSSQEVARTACVCAKLCNATLALLQDHIVHGRPLCPAAAYLEMLQETLQLALFELLPFSNVSQPSAVSHVVLSAPLEISAETVLLARIFPPSGNVDIHDEINFSACRGARQFVVATCVLLDATRHCANSISVTTRSTSFQYLKECTSMPFFKRSSTENLEKLTLPSQSIAAIVGSIDSDGWSGGSPAALDATFQSAAAARRCSDLDTSPLVPVSFSAFISESQSQHKTGSSQVSAKAVVIQGRNAIEEFRDHRCNGSHVCEIRGMRVRLMKQNVSMIHSKPDSSRKVQMQVLPPVTVFAMKAPAIPSKQLVIRFHESVKHLIRLPKRSIRQPSTMSNQQLLLVSFSSASRTVAGTIDSLIAAEDILRLQAGTEILERVVAVEGNEAACGCTRAFALETREISIVESRVSPFVVSRRNRDVTNRMPILASSTFASEVCTPPQGSSRTSFSSSVLPSCMSKSISFVSSAGYMSTTHVVDVHGIGSKCRSGHHIHPYGEQFSQLVDVAHDLLGEPARCHHLVIGGSSPSPGSDAILHGGSGGIGLALTHHLTCKLKCNTLLRSRAGRFHRIQHAHRESRIHRKTSMAVFCPFTHSSAKTCLIASDDSLSDSEDAFMVGPRDISLVIQMRGIIRDALARQLVFRDARSVISAKVSAGERIRFFVADARRIKASLHFSSIAALLGSPGQTSYSAINAQACDARAVNARHAGHPDIAIQWGPWDGIGMTASKICPHGSAEVETESSLLSASGNLTGSLARRGFGYISPIEGLNICQRLLCSNSIGVPSVICVARMNWELFVRNSSSRRRDAFMFLHDYINTVPRNMTGSRHTNDNVTCTTQKTVTSTTSSGRVQLVENRSSYSTTSEIEDTVCRRISTFIGRLPAPDEPLIDAGLDSLSSIDVQSELCETFDVFPPCNNTV
jgi:acyl carrier protein